MRVVFTFGDLIMPNHWNNYYYTVYSKLKNSRFIPKKFLKSEPKLEIKVLIV